MHTVTSAYLIPREMKSWSLYQNQTPSIQSKAEVTCEEAIRRQDGKTVFLSSSLFCWQAFKEEVEIQFLCWHVKVL